MAVIDYPVILLLLAFSVDIFGQTEYYPIDLKKFDYEHILFPYNCTGPDEKCVDASKCVSIMTHLHGSNEELKGVQRKFCGYPNPGIDDARKVYDEDEYGARFLHLGYPLACCPKDHICTNDGPICSTRAPTLRIRECGISGLFYINYAARYMIHSEEVIYEGIRPRPDCSLVKRSADGENGCVDRQQEDEGRDKRSAPQPDKVEELKKYPKDKRKTEDGNGKRQKRFTGGVPARIGQFPFLATIYFTDRRTKSKRYLGCLGTILHHQLVLTTLTCTLKGSIAEIWVGDFDVNNASRAHEQYNIVNSINYRMHRNPQRFGVDEVMIHHRGLQDRFDFNTTFFPFNYALIKLNDHIKFNDFTMPVCLPLADAVEPVEFPLWDQDFVISVGYGIQSEFYDESIPRYSHMGVYDMDQCLHYYSDYLTDSHFEAHPVHKINHKEMFACAAAGGDGPCTLDEGGPVFRLSWCGMLYQIGIHLNQHPLSCTAQGQPTIFGRLDTIRGWLAYASLAIFTPKKNRNRRKLDWESRGQCLNPDERSAYSRF